jgi:hypothetical protein
MSKLTMGIIRYRGLFLGLSSNCPNSGGSLEPFADHVDMRMLKSKLVLEDGVEFNPEPDVVVGKIA